MSDFINTTDALGDDAVCDGIITKTLMEYAESHITTIGDYAFYNCNKLTKLDLPNATSIGVFAFYGCSTMKTINLPVVTLIDNYAFYNGYALESVNTPLVTEIGKSAFRYCSCIAEDFDGVFLRKYLFTCFHFTSNNVQSTSPFSL